MLNSFLSIRFIHSYSFSIFLIMAFLLGSFAFWKKAREEHYDEHDLIDLILMTSVWSLVSGRLVYILINFDRFGLNLLYWLSLWGIPGLNWVGLFGGGLFAVYRFSQNHKWETIKILDLMVIGLALAQALINFGVFLSGASLGKVTNLPIGVIFPGTFEARHPVSLYAAIAWFGGFFLFWWLEGKYRRFEWYQKYKGDSLPGFLFFTYIMFFGLIGIIVSQITELPFQINSFNLDLIIRIVLFFVGFGGLIWRSGLSNKYGFDFNFKKLSKR